MAFLARHEHQEPCVRSPEPPTYAARMLHSTMHVRYRDWCAFCVASRARSSLHRRVVVNKTVDTLPKFQAVYMFIWTVTQSKTQPCITFVETRSGAVLSFMCARYVNLSPTVSSIPVIVVQESCAREKKREHCYALRRKQAIRATGLSKLCTDTYRDSHDTIRHKSRRILAHSFQQYHLPFHLLFVVPVLYSQDSECDPTGERHSSTCQAFHMFHLCACLVNRYSR